MEADMLGENSAVGVLFFVCNWKQEYSEQRSIFFSEINLIGCVKSLWNY